MSVAIDIRDVSRRYGTAVAVDAASLHIPAGQFVAIVGGSGAGKTTLLRMINRLVEPDAGDVRLDGRDVCGEPPHALRRRIGYVIQGVGLLPHLTVSENVAILPRLLNWPEDRVVARVAEMLELVDLPVADFGARRPDQLSGGQRQRVGFARALAGQAQAVLLDEPFGALDPLNRLALGDAYRALHDRLGLTSIMVTHDIAEAIVLADRLVVMRQGRIVADGAPADLVRSGPPEARALLETPGRNAARMQARLGGPA